MKVKLTSYAHSVNGLALFVIPETDEERVLLKAMWKHGKMETCNGIADNSEQGFCVQWRPSDEKEATR